MSNDDENKFPLSVKKFPIGQSDESNHHDISQHNRREFLYCFLIKKVNLLFISGRQKPQEPFSNMTNDIFHFDGPRCWTQFRLNRSEVFRCLHE